MWRQWNAAEAFLSRGFSQMRVLSMGVFSTKCGTSPLVVLYNKLMRRVLKRGSSECVPVYGQ